MANVDCYFKECPHHEDDVELCEGDDCVVTYDQLVEWEHQKSTHDRIEEDANDS